MKSHLYQKRSHILILWIALLLIPLLSSAQPQKHIEIIPFEEDSLQISASNPRFYILGLANPPKDLDLLISVLPEGSSCAPKLFVSKTKEFPQNIHDADYSSTSTSGNILLISHKDLKDAPMSLFIGLNSGDSLCSTNILVEWTKEMKTTVNEEKVIANSNDLNSAIIRLAIPKQKDVERIVIHLDALKTAMEELSPLQVFINQGKSIPFGDVLSVSRKGSWFEGKTIVIEPTSSLFCTDCTYTLRLKLKENSSIKIQTVTFKKNAQINGIPLLDGIREGIKNTFRFFHKEGDAVLSVKVHQGAVGLIFGCDKEPLPKKYYDWDEVIGDSTEIILGQNGDHKCPTGNYFLRIETQEFSVYSLRILERSSNQPELGKNTLLTGGISPKEKITYELLVPLFMAEEEVLLDLHSKQSLEVDISICRFPTDCPGLLPVDSSSQITNYYGFDDLSIQKFDYKETPSDSGIQVKIFPKESGCYPILAYRNRPTQGPTAVCAYLVTLSNQLASPVKFSLSSECKGPKLLRTSEAYYDVVAQNTSIYYAFPITDKKAEYVQFQFTRFFGDLDIFISNSTKYPNHQDSTDFHSFHKDLITIKGAPILSEVYYIGVHGVKASSFSLSAIFSEKKREIWDKKGDWGFTLSPGKPQKGFFLKGSEMGWKYPELKKSYKIVLNQDKDWEGTLCIKVNSPTKIYVAVNNNGKAPSLYEKVMWEGTDYKLEISSSDPKFLKQGVYYVDVHLARDPGDPELPDDLTHYIIYTLKDKLPNPVHIFLSPKIPCNGTIQKGESRYFESLLLEDNSPLTIYKSENIDLYVSTDPKNKYPNQDSHDFLIKDQLSLNWAEACKTEDVLGCPVYITAISNERTPSNYSLSVKSGSAAIALEESHEIQLLTPTNNRPALFYYHASPQQNSVVTISCPGKELVIYAKRTKLDHESLDQLWREAPDENNAEFISSLSSNTNDTIFYVPPLGDDFSLALSVYFKDIEGLETTYKIMASSQAVAYSFIGTPQTREIKKDHYTYFKFHSLMVKCTLLFSLAANAEVGLVISFGENTRPTLSNHQFASTSYSKTHILEINNTDISPGNSMLGYFIIGVYGHTSASFALSVAFEDQKMMELKPGVPVEMSLQWSSVLYFKYFHEPERNLQINLTQLSGEVNLYASDLGTELPDKTHHKWKIVNANPQKVLTIPMEDHKACVSCLYLIMIETVAYQSKFSLVVNQLSNILSIENLFLYSGLLKPQRSVVKMLKNETQETQCNIEFSEEKFIVLGSKSPSINLTNYLWKETLITNQSIPLKTQGESYILLHNPTEKALSFSFIITPKITPLGRLEEIYNLAPYEKKFFEYAVPEDAVETKGTFNGYSGVVYLQAEVDIIFYAAKENSEKSMELFLNKGQKVQAVRLPKELTAFPQESTKEPKDFSFQAESAPRTKSNESHAIVEQKFSGKMHFFDSLDQRKYLIEIANPLEFPVEFRLDIGIPLPTHTVIPQAQAKEFTGDLGAYEMVLKTSGNWYFWVYSCDATVELKVEEGDPETAMATIPKGGSYLYQEAIQNNGTKRFVARASRNSLENKGKFIMFSSLVNEENFKSYDVKNDSLAIQVSIQSHDENAQNNITVQFEPVEFTESSDPSDEVIYQVNPFTAVKIILLKIQWDNGILISVMKKSKKVVGERVKLCPERAQQYAEAKFCLRDETCLDYEVRLSVKQNEMITVDFQRLRTGKYSVRIKATIFHKNQVIKFIQPYTASFIELKTKKPVMSVEENRIEGENKSVLWKIVIGIVALGLVVAAGLIGLKKVKGFQENQGDDLQSPPDSSTKGFKPLEDEEVDIEDSQIERNGV